MRAGTIQRTRALAMRQGLAAGLAPLDRGRLSTEHCHAARPVRAFREYQSDSSSKRPTVSVVPTLSHGNRKARKT